MNVLNSLVFDLSPTPMWLEDYSAVKRQFQQWREQGIQDLYTFLSADPLLASACARQIKILNVNKRTLELFQATNFETFIENLETIMCYKHPLVYIDLLTQLWNNHGGSFFVEETKNYTIYGETLHLTVRGDILADYPDWSVVLTTTENITPYKHALQREVENLRLAEALFQFSPAALLMENFSVIKEQIDALKIIGVTNLEHYIDMNPLFLRDCLSAVIIEDLNDSTLKLFNAPDKTTFIQNYQATLTHQHMPLTMRQNLVMMWNGTLSHRIETTFIAFDHTIRHVYLQLNVFPGHEHDWSKVQIALTDITARKRAEANLIYLSEHDALTNLKNRVFYMQELKRLASEQELACIYMDLNGLKTINDQFGHTTGNQLIQRAGNIFKQVTRRTRFNACRIGGDEFVILMPQTDESTLLRYIARIKRLIERDNQQNATLKLSLSIGFAARQKNESIKHLLHRADQLMYLDKKAYYATYDRRSETTRHT